MYFFARHGDVSCNDYFFCIVVVHSYAGAAFPDVLSPESQKCLSLLRLSLEIPTWVKATNPRQTDRQTPGYGQYLQGHRTCHETGFVQRHCGKRSTV